MATTTPNFGWAVPTSTDLVKDGAVAIETLGDSIDASLVDLKGGTSGQVLKKNSNTDMDFIWSADSAGMTNPMTTTGDTIYSSSGSTPARLGIGSTGQVLTVASGVPSWATPASGGATFAGCRVLLTANQSVANSTDVAITFTDETYDTDGYHSNSTNTSRLTVPSGKAGYYQINANITWAANASGIRDFNIYKNGNRANYFTFNPQASNSQSFQLSSILYGAVGDYFEMFVFQNSGGALNVQSPGVGATSFSIGYLGA
jgi:hypothetical protein